MMCVMAKLQLISIQYILANPSSSVPMIEKIVRISEITLI